MKKHFSFYIILWFFSALFYTNGLRAQDHQTTQQDTLRQQLNSQSVKLPDPESIQSLYTYDPKTNLFYFNQKVGNYNMAYPWILTPEQYYSRILKEKINQNFKDRNQAIAGNSEAAKKKRKNLLPTYYINSKFFESVFGGKTIDIQPKGNFSIDLGLRYTKRDNPALPIKNRSNLAFDFDQKISMGLKGKIGTRLNLDLNYDTQSTFDFNNQIKLNYTPTEDDILQNIELGNVSMKTHNSLIHGAQSLFGLKTELRFGKTYITAVMAEQKSGTKTIQAQGDKVVQKFEQPILEYEDNRHYFLAQYFKDHYTEAVKNYPFINSTARITRIEVWKTNRSTQTENIRNIVALQDLGENYKIGLDNIPPGFVVNATAPPDNSVNKFDPALIGNGGLLNSNIRDIFSVSQGFSGVTVTNGTDYVSMENTVKLDSTQYTLHPQLGYITLKQKLNADEVLAVAFEYTINGQVYRVGEFSDNGIVYPQTLIVKLLKSNMVSTEEPDWDLMMKNIYALNAFDIDPNDFRLNILYVNPTPLNYINPINGTPLPNDVQQRILLNVFNMDRLTAQGDPQPKGDGFFDFIPGITIDAREGRVIFTSTEPFGKYLFDKLKLGNEDYNDINTWNQNQKHYVYKELYQLSKTQAEQFTNKNKFILKGRYKTAGGGGIPIGGFNIPRGSVTVTAGGRTLVEGIDYVVNYQIGRVNIINPSISQANIPIQVSVEQNSIFQQTTKVFTGLDVEHQFSPDFILGATYMSFKEKPLSWKANYGYEPLNNKLVGFNGQYATKVPFLTRLVNRLPNIKTDAESNFSIKAEAAYLFPGLAKVSDVNGRSTTYIEDFESSQNFIDLRSYYAWHLSSVPARFPESQQLDHLNSGKNRAKLAWYTIDPVFYTNPPTDITQDDLSQEEVRQISIKEIFDQDIPAGYPTVVNPLNLSFFPRERGPYNFDTNLDPNTGELLQPQQRWAGIMRYLQTNDFEQANVEYIDMWVMDPYYNNPNPPAGGKLYIDLGYMSEDILYDGRKQYENGLPGDGSDNNVIMTNLARVPTHQSIVYAFSNDPDERPNQDVGFDGLSDAREQSFFANYLNSLPQNLRSRFQDDPSADDYKNYLNASGGIVKRYKNFNGTEGNTPIDVANNNPNNGVTGNNTFPDVEDIDRDQSMNTIESYYEYALDIKPGLTVNDPYVSDIKETTVTLPNGNQQTSRWIQFKIPIHEYTSKQGNISDFRSIKFMRMYLTGFTDNQLTLRFASLNLVRADWKKYQLTLQPTDPNPNDDNTTVETAAVSIQDNATRQPIPYVLPPGIQREEIYQQNSQLKQNEQSLSLKVCNLEPKDGRGVYKYNSVDMRQYKRLEMFIHAESMEGQTPLQDDEAVGFIRFGSDVTDNFYEVQIPLKVTSFGTSDPEQIWPVENRIDLKLDLLNKIKLEMIKNHTINTGNLPTYFSESDLDPEAAGKPNPLIIGIKGNPNFGDIKVIMVGVRNKSAQHICGEYWFNELRLSEMKNKGGWASNASIDANLADFATLSFTGGISTEGFGGLEQGPLERNLEDTKRYNFNTNINMGQLLPKKWHITLPVNYTISEEFITPKYDPIWRDITVQDRLRIANSNQRDSIRQVAQAYTRHRGITLAGVKKGYATETAKTPPGQASNLNSKKKKNKKHFFDIENFTFDFAYNQVYHSDYEIASNSDETSRLGMNYAYNFKELAFKPFKKTKKLKSKYLRFIKDFNFNIMPSSLTVTSNINRRFNNLHYREIEDYGLAIPPLQNRDYTFDWGYTVNYSPAKSIQTSFGITHNRAVKNYLLSDGSTDFNNTIWSDFFNIGEPLTHTQNINVSYNLPLKKIPLLSFLNVTYVYNGTYQWQKSSEALADVNGYNLGNDLQNSNSHQLNTNIDMRKLYRELGLTKLQKRLMGKGRPKKRKAKKKPKLKQAKTKDETKKIPEKQKEKNKKKALAQGPGQNKFLGTLLGILTGFQSLKVNYRQNNGMMLPGYMQSVGFLGTLQPSVPFALGWNDDNIRYEAAKHGWLTQYPDFNKPYIETFSEELTYQGTIKPAKILSITFKGQKTYMENLSEQFNAVGNTYHPLVPTTMGNFSVSTILAKTAFEKISLSNSPAFERMQNNRLAIARRLAAQRGVTVPASGYPDGYGPLQTEVVMYAFLSGYADSNPNNMALGPFKQLPIPNWRVKFSGLTKIKWLKKIFKNLSLEHNYQSDYTVNQFNNNLQTYQNPNARDASGNYYAPFVMDNVTLTEAFNPLIKVNMELQNSLKLDFALKQDRSLSLNLNNYTLSEVSGKEYVVGLGYRLKDITLPLRLAGRRIEFTSDLILKINASIRKNLTVLRSLSDQNNQITAGQTMYNLKFTADYALTKSLSAILFYNHSYSEYAISTSYPFTNIRGGFTLKYTFGN